MVFEMEYVALEGGDGMFRSIDDADTILSTYKSGKNVVLHFVSPKIENYMSICGVLNDGTCLTNDRDFILTVQDGKICYTVFSMDVK